MSLKTAFLNLFKPEANEKFPITGTEGYNKNMDLIDAAVKKNADDISTNTSAISQLNSESTDSGDLVGNTDICTSVSFSVEIIGKIAIVSIYAILKTTTTRLSYVILASGIPSKYLPEKERFIYGGIFDSGEMVTDNQFLAQVKPKSSQDAGKIYLKSRTNITSGNRIRVSYICKV